MKRYIRALLMSAALIVCSVTVCGASFSDINPDTEVGQAVLNMHESGIINGYPDGTFRPEATLTRAEFVTIINKIYGFTVEAENIFTDVAMRDWYYSQVLIGVQAGYIKGMGDGTFRPNETVSREQVCVMLNSILNVEKLPYDKQVTDYISDWARDSVEKLISNRLFELDENGRFRAGDAITRAEACIALEKCIVSDVEAIDMNVDLDSMARDELEAKLRSLIDCMETKVIPNCSYELNKRVAVLINESLKAYLADPEYDYEQATKDTYEVYRTMTRAQADELKGLIFKHCDTDALMIMYNFFYSAGVESLLQ